MAARRALDAPNIHVLDRRPYAALPGYLAALDCALIPFRATPLTAAVSPIKLYEYLAAGLPVVSTPIPAATALGREVAVGAGTRFLEAVEQAVAGANDVAAAEARRRRARANTWDHRIATIREAIVSAESARAGERSWARTAP
jgi:glycosyltransferase involved in cell wall biosynthesis